MVKPKIINTPTHPTTGQIVVRDYEAGKIKDLAHHIDKLLNKELDYGIHLGKQRSVEIPRQWTGMPPTKDKPDNGEKTDAGRKVRKVDIPKRKKS